MNGVADRVHLVVGQGEFLCFPDNFFDLVFGKGVLHHLDLAHAAREMYRVLKPGGVAIMFDPLGENRLLEWARNCPLRSSKHRHTADERSLLYRDIEELRAVFPGLTFRETGLFTVIKVLFRKVEVGMVAIPRWESVLRLLARVDAWLLRRLPMVRPLAQYVVISMVKLIVNTDASRAANAEGFAWPAESFVRRLASAKESHG